MTWSRGYIDVLLRFAARVAEIEALSIDTAVLSYTPLYLNIGLTRSFDPQDVTWQEFLRGYHTAADPIAWVHSFYLARARAYDTSPFGCFSYTYEPETQTIRFHFGNRDVSGDGPLSATQQQTRRQELAAMFAAIQREVPQATAVRGRSWMYNLPAYCRLFPQEYVQTAVPVEPEFQFMSLWGQFLDHRGALRYDRAATFLEGIARATTVDELIRCFPWPVRAPRCHIAYFYTFYELA